MIGRAIRKGMVLLAAGASGATAATLTVSIERTTMPETQWSSFTAATSQWEDTVDGYGGEYGYVYTVETDADSIDFVYTFPEGWDYAFYDLWRNEVLAIMNSQLPASAGFRWDIEVEGSVNPDSNPLRDLD